MISEWVSHYIQYTHVMGCHYAATVLAFYSTSLLTFLSRDQGRHGISALLLKRRGAYKLSVVIHRGPLVMFELFRVKRVCEVQCI